MLASLKKRLVSVFDYNRFQQGAITVATAAASAAVLYAVYPPTFVICTMFVVICHELGHWWFGRKYSRAALPLFFPLGIVVIGATLVYPADTEDKQVQIYSAGPFAGMLAGACLLIGGLIVMSTGVILSSLSLLGCELYSITYGSDARRIRRINQAHSLRGTHDTGTRNPVGRSYALPATVEDH